LEEGDNKDSLTGEAQTLLGLCQLPPCLCGLL